MTMQRRAADHGEPTNADIMSRIVELEGKVDAFVAEHKTEHRDLNQMLAALQSAAILREHRLTNLEKAALEISDLHDFKVQITTIGRMTQFIVGSSLLAAIAAVISLIVSLTHVAGT
jgi:hypothetical protein